MKENAADLASHIDQILREHSTSEIREAVSILRKHQTNSELLLNYLDVAAKPASSTGREKGSTVKKSSKPLDQVTSKAVRNLEKSDPVKYRRLLEFENRLRQGRVLKTNASVRRFGESISKDFRSRASRKDNISALMSALVRLEEDRLNKALDQAMESSHEKKSGEYQRLAEYLMRVN